MQHIFLLLLTFFSFTVLTAQEQVEEAEKATATLYGSVTDADNLEALDFANVYIKGTNQVVETKRNGSYVLVVPADENFTLIISRVGYIEATAKIKGIPTGNSRKIDVELVPVMSDVEIVVRESRIQDGGMIREDVSTLKLLPTVSGNLESLLPSIALGASSGSGGELTSQYNVRGGNYDENLVYVNDFEIYRPQLVRAGQQEGLSFPNIDLINSLTFSSGGFDAKHGDKLSSVLDIKYKLPQEFGASVSASALGGSVHIEGSKLVGGDKYKRFRYLVGARYKTTKYLLGSLDIKGEYTPNFADFQGYFTYDLSRDWQIGVIGNYNRSEYEFVPVSRSTGFGLVDFALELFSTFEGQEVSDFTTNLGGVALTYFPDRDRNPLFLKFLASTQFSDENETIDIISDYSLRQIESNLGSDNFGEVLAELGTGTQHTFVRNYLNSNVTNIEHKGGIEFQGKEDKAEEDDIEKSHFLQWAVKYQHEFIRDEIHEWERLDSAGYSLPYSDQSVEIFNYLDSENVLESNRISAFVQDTYSWKKDSISEIKLSVGVRGQYWDLNNEGFVTPRAQILYKPLKKDKDISWKLAAGLYFQPAFYRELRYINGDLNRDLSAQKSAHFVGGFTSDFYLGKLSPKKFRLIVEAYYKKLWDVVSYEIDNVRIRYAAENDATGYVAGIDLRLNGEFVPGAESWFNLSFLRARESLNGVQHLRREIGDSIAVNVKDVPRPTDQFMQLVVFFQDHLPNNENFKMHLNFTVGTGLPYGLLGNNREFRNTYRFLPYHRVDIGFSTLLWDESRKAEKPRHPLRFSKKTWLSLEVFNLLQVQNAASNTWVKTVFNQQYAVRNYLTSRRINLRMRMEF